MRLTCRVTLLPIMPSTPSAALGEFELLVLLSTLKLGDRAYPFAITKDLDARGGRSVSRAAVLITLERLEDKELVSSRYGDPSEERGGRPRRYFEVKPRGVKAVQQALARIDALTAGLEDVLGRK